MKRNFNKICNENCSSFCSAPKSHRSKLNCRGTISPGPLEAVFFGPLTPTNTMKCTGNSNLTSSAARHLHKDICMMLLESLESLKIALSEFTTVLPQQWVSLMGNGVTNGEWLGPEQRLKKISEAATVSLQRFDGAFIIEFYTFLLWNSMWRRYWRRRMSSQPEPTQTSLNCVPSAYSIGEKSSQLRGRRPYIRYWQRSIIFCGCDDSPRASS